MMAAERQMLDDKVKEKESVRQHEPRPKVTDKEKEVIELRRELADLKNQFNQQNTKRVAGGEDEEDKVDMIGGRS